MNPLQRKPSTAGLYQELKNLVLSHGGGEDTGDNPMPGEPDGDEASPAAGKDGAALVVEVAPKDGSTTPHTCPACGQPMP